MSLRSNEFGEDAKMEVTNVRCAGFLNPIMACGGTRLFCVNTRENPFISFHSVSFGNSALNPASSEGPMLRMFSLHCSVLSILFAPELLSKVNGSS